jgi:nitrilase
MEEEIFTVAAVQAAPVFMDRGATVEKACRLIAEAAGNGARLIVFPEAFIPAYPDWVWNLPAGKIAANRELYGKLLEASVSVPSEATERLCAAAKAAGAYVVVGIVERNSGESGNSLYNTRLYLDDTGNILGHHRKLIPTLSERTVWGYGGSGTMEVFETSLGKLGGLTCWENYMPLARYSLYAQGISLYVAPTYDESSTWQASLRHIGREGGTYVIGCCMAYRKADFLAALPELEPYYEEVGEWINSGHSMIVDPDGTILAGPLHREEGILYAEVSPGKLRETRWNLDVAGHYARPDIFSLTVKRAPTPLVRWEEAAEEEEPPAPEEE